MSEALRLPEPEARDLEQFQVYSRVEIVGLLRELIDRRALATVYFHGGASSIVTPLLAVNPEFEEIVFDCASNARDNALLARSVGLVAVAFLDQVKVQFRAGRAEETVFEDRPAFRVRLPDSVLRLQRRNHFRVRTPVTRPLVLAIPAGTAGGRPRALRVEDLSCGGVGAVAGKDDGPFEPGAVFGRCRMELPGVGAIECTVEVRHTRLGAGGALRLGLRFVDLPVSTVTRVQRYINHLERAQLGRER